MVQLELEMERCQAICKRPKRQCLRPADRYAKDATEKRGAFTHCYQHGGEKIVQPPAPWVPCRATKTRTGEKCSKRALHYHVDAAEKTGSFTYCWWHSGKASKSEDTKHHSLPKKADSEIPDDDSPPTNAKKEPRQEVSRQKSPQRQSSHQHSSCQESSRPASPKREDKKDSKEQPAKEESSHRSASPSQQEPATAREMYSTWKKEVDECMTHRPIRRFPFPEVDTCLLEDIGCKFLKAKRNMCPHELQALLKGAEEYSVPWLKQERRKWRPIAFAEMCSEDFRENGTRLAREMFELFGDVIEIEQRNSC